MKATDLMIGDLVLQTDPIHNGEIMRVKELRIIHLLDGQDMYLVCSDEALVSEECIGPIPLTAEIIDMVGHHPKMAIFWDDKKTEETGCNWYELRICKDGDTALTMEIRYVHELQHALRLLGVDIDIDIDIEL